MPISRIFGRRHPSRMKALLRLIHALENGLLYTLVAGLLGLALYQIVLRNAFGGGIYWADPLLRVMVLWMALVGAMVATREGGHISIDVLNHYLGDRAKTVMRSLTGLFSMAVCFIAAYYGFVFVLEERQYGDMAFAQVPAWLCEASIPLGLSIIGPRGSDRWLLGLAESLRPA